MSLTIVPPAASEYFRWTGRNASPVERTFGLSQREERFRLIANATNDVAWDRDLVNNRIWWSDSFYSAFGFERTPETGNSNFWIAKIHEDDRERIIQVLQRPLIPVSVTGR
jgi:two-component system, chemotaxis family, CheB/CheR fusion protein